MTRCQVAKSERPLGWNQKMSKTQKRLERASDKRAVRVVVLSNFSSLPPQQGRTRTSPSCGEGGNGDTQYQLLGTTQGQRDAGDCGS